MLLPGHAGLSLSWHFSSYLLPVSLREEVVELEGAESSIEWVLWFNDSMLGSVV